MSAISAVRIDPDGTLIDVAFQPDTVVQGMERLVGGPVDTGHYRSRDGEYAVCVAVYEFSITDGWPLNQPATRALRAICGPELHALHGPVVVTGWRGEDLVSLSVAERCILATEADLTRLDREADEAGKDTRDDSQSGAGESTRPDDGDGRDPLLLRWTGRVSVTDGDGVALVHLVDETGADALLVMGGMKHRRALTSLLDAELVDVRERCGTDGCGTLEDLDPSDPVIWGWVRLQVAAVDDAPRWWCSSMCAWSAMARAGESLAADERAAELDGGL